MSSPQTKKVTKKVIKAKATKAPTAGPVATEAPHVTPIATEAPVVQEVTHVAKAPRKRASVKKVKKTEEVIPAIPLDEAMELETKQQEEDSISSKDTKEEATMEAKAAIDFQVKAFPTYTLPLVKQLAVAVTEYKSLQKYHKAALKLFETNPTATNRSKIRAIEKSMKELIEKGLVTTKRRIPSTGRLEEVEMEYKDTLENRTKGRVGQKFKVSRWVDAEYEEVKVERFSNKKRKRSNDADPDAPPAKKAEPSLWIQALLRARTELGYEKQFVTVYSTLPENPTEKHQIGYQLHTLAKKYHAELKAAQAPVVADVPDETPRIPIGVAVA